MTTQRIVQAIYRKSGIRLALHVCFWLWLLAVRWHLSGISFNVYNGLPTGELFKLNLCSTSLLAGFYYVVVYGLYPYIARTRRYFAGLMAVTVLFILYTAADGYFERELLNTCSGCMAAIKENNPHYFDFLQLQFSNMIFKRLATLGLPLGVVLALAMPVSIKAGMTALRSAYAKTDLIREKARVELDFLKSQYNPHFLFNSLNNIYGLVLGGKADQSAVLIAQLSELLRYTLYEANREWATMTEEGKWITSYIELEKIRLNHTKVTLDLTIDDPGATVPSLLLMPLVENAFKHVGDLPGSFIRFVIRADRQQLYFMSENTVGDPDPEESGGIGLAHLLKRLDFFYPDRHEYRIIEHADIYGVALICKL